jgi:hypothetical protein
MRGSTDAGVGERGATKNKPLLDTHFRFYEQTALETALWAGPGEIVHGRAAEALSIGVDARGHDAGVVVFIMVHCEVVTGFVCNEDATGASRGGESNVVDAARPVSLAHGAHVRNADGAPRVVGGKSLDVVFTAVVLAFVGCHLRQIV